MSRLPEMMALISAAYRGEAIDAEVIEAALYERAKAVAERAPQRCGSRPPD